MHGQGANPPGFAPFSFCSRRAGCATMRSMPVSERSRFLSTAALLALVSATPSWAQDAAKPVYRCPGPPVLYTDSLSAQEAKDKGCRTIDGAPVTVLQGPARPRPANGNAPAGTAAAGGARPADGRIDANAQRARDSDARRILGDELRREEERLAAMQAEFNGGNPERSGDERNYQRYQERVAEMRAAITRKEADVAALKRELAKLPQ